MGNIEYHLSELEIALDENNEKRILPDLLSTDDVVLDIGCGIGQTFLAIKGTDRTCIGIDVDEEVIEYGKKHYGDDIDFFVADASDIPYSSNSVDLIISRVAIPYTNVPKVIEEIKRLLNDNGRVWITIHTKKMVKGWIANAFRAANFKDIIHKIYVLINGYMFKYLGFVFPFINGGYESWQCPQKMMELMEKNGIKAEAKLINDHTVITGTMTTK